MALELDRERFKVTSTFLAVAVPCRKIDSVVKNAQISKCLRRGRNLRYIVPVSQVITKDVPINDKDHKIVLFKAEYKTKENLPEPVQKIIEDFHVVEATETQTYQDLTSGEVLSTLLPKDVIVPTSFETIGHIAHLNLLSTQVPYGKIIGQVLIDKNPGIKTVVNKLHNIEDEFRACPFELLAGEPSYQAVLVENGYRLHIDYEKVFWNSRLSRERETVAREMIPKGSIVCDVMAGVGAFGIYLASETACEVYSNDLNAAARPCMEANIVANKCHGRIQTFTMDGRDFIRKMLNDLVDASKETPIQQTFAEKYRQGAMADKRRPKRARIEVPKWDLKSDRPIYFLMNLPAIAIDFLDAFRGCVKSVDTWRSVHVLVYSFAVPEKADEELKQRLEAVLGEGFEIVGNREVRDVSPTKSMYCSLLVIKPLIMRA